MIVNSELKLVTHVSLSLYLYLERLFFLIILSMCIAMIHILLQVSIPKSVTLLDIKNRMERAELNRQQYLLDVKRKASRNFQRVQDARVRRNSLFQTKLVEIDVKTTTKQANAAQRKQEHLNTVKAKAHVNPIVPSPVTLWRDRQEAAAIKRMDFCLLDRRKPEGS
ncbi:hypothetical protein GEMRC1_010308 [Eukaryota sp. GEM-RC1]